MALTDKLTAIANAIRIQSGKTGKLTLAQMPTEIINLQSLNFEVVGSKPQNPEENTIWVNTDTEITGWYFGADDISGQLDVSNAVNATNVVSGVSGGAISFKGDLDAMWSSTYIAKVRLVAGVTYALSASLGYGRCSIAKTPSQRVDGVKDFVENVTLGDILSPIRQSVEITPFVTSDYYINFCTDTKGPNGARPAFETAIFLFPKAKNNLLPYPFKESTKVKNGITFTDYGDGRVKVTGTLDSATTFIHYYFASQLELPPGNYRLVGCPNVSNTNFELWENRGDMIGGGKTIDFTLNKITYVNILTSITKGDTLNAIYCPKLYISDGIVWFPIGNSSPVAFNALKKNGIQVYPISAKQYVGGACVDKTAQTYQGGKWCDWLTEVPFFANGTFNTAQFGEITGSYSISNGAIRLGRHSSVSHTVAFDLTPFSTIEVVTSKYNDVDGQVKLKNKSGAEVASVGYAGLGTHVLDVSNLTGEHYINITCGSNSDNDYTDLSSIKFLI